MADIIAMFSRWANSGLSHMLSWVSSSFDGPASSSFEPILCNAKDDFQRIMRLLPRIEAVLADAEEREILDRSVDLWLSELRLLAYDIDDVVDEYEYEVLRARVETYHHGKFKQRDDDRHDNDEEVEHRNILASSSSQVPTISNHMAEKLREIRERFDEIERDRKALRLREEDGVRRFVAPQRSRPTSSLVDESSIFGREGDKEKIIELLFSDMESSNNIQVSNKITVIPIVGMGGVGKTTLAQLIYNDPKISHHFDLRLWIYVSEDFDLVRLTREIYRSITNKSCGDDAGFDYLQDSIKKKLMLSKRTLLVLDDVWNEEQCLWEFLQVPFHDAGIVSILVTTRNKKVANIMGTINPFHLGFLSEEEGWRLFQQRALCDDNNLLEIGYRIVQKCGGLPLAIKILGSHLRFERDEDKWMSILESELWELDPGASEILPALKLSYQRMPAHLKPCFRYCSMFPKDKIPDKNRLVWLWMAQGYIHYKIPGKTIEEVGREYFDELLGRSFFQATESKYFFKMHDLIFDLAVSISSKEFNTMKLEDGKQNKFISNNIRHLVVYDHRTLEAQKGTSVFPFLKNHVALRSIFYYSQRRIEDSPISISNDFQFLNSSPLRTLHISSENYELRISKFQSLIASLKHLRYLYISNGMAHSHGFGDFYNSILFNSFHNLQVLDLFHSYKSVSGVSISNVINLRHLILPLFSFMPCGISKLTSLQTLKYVTVKNRSYYCGGLREIEGLTSLAGSCSITNIIYANDLEDIKKANISKKEHIQKLCFDWFPNKYSSDDGISIEFSNDYDRERIELAAEAKLEALKPHNNLKELEIHNYNGIQFPLWLGDPSYSKLQAITLEGCNEWDGSCRVLDRDLPSLQSISIIECAKLKNINIVQPSSLRRLVIKSCHELTTLHGLCSLHGLEKLKIQSCHNILISTEERLPSKLQFVCFEDCWKLTMIMGLQNLQSLEKLKLERCPKLQFSLDEQLSSMPGVVKVTDCPGLREWCQRYGFKFIEELSQIEELNLSYFHHIESRYGSANLVSLKTLYIHNFYKSELPEDEWIPCSLNTLHLMSCHLLKFFPPYQNLSTLKLLKIGQCGSLKYLPGLQMMESLEKLEIIDCPQFILSPNQRLPSKLQFLLIRNCRSLMWLPGLQQLFSLRYLRLYECHNLMLLPLEQLPFMHQVQLEIINCSKLGEWYRRYNISYNNQVIKLQQSDSSKALFARSSQQIKLWLDEASPLFEKICVLDYDEAYLESEKWPAFRLLGFYVCSCVHLMTINFGDNFRRLKKLRIWNCFHLEVLYKLSKLTSLQYMDISNCPNLHYMIPPPYSYSFDHRMPMFNWESLKISKCPKLCLDDELLQYLPRNIEIHACPQLQEWCQENYFTYFQD